MSAVVGQSRLDKMDTFVAPSSKKGYQDVDRALKATDLLDFAAEQTRRTATDPASINYVYCIVFPTKPKGLGFTEKLLANCFEVEEQTEEEMIDIRHSILKDIRAAGFAIELVYSTTRKEILCKIGCNDARLLKEAELRNYKLELEPASLKHVLELGIKETDKEAQVDKPKHPIYLDYNNYDEEQFMKIQRSGGEGTLPLFLYKNFNPAEPEESMLPLSEAKRNFFKQTTAEPFEHIFFRYDAGWEQKIITEHKVQLYRSYNDGTILRTADRIALAQSALARSHVIRSGVRGANLNLDKLQYKSSIIAHYPIQYSQQTRKANDITSKQLFQRFKWRIPGLGWKVCLPWKQPIQDVRNFCGEKIAYYFAFLEFYSFWLLFSSFFGLLLFGFQLSALYSNLDTINIVQNNVAVREFSFTELQLNNLSTPDDIANAVHALNVTSDRTPFAISEDGNFLLLLETPIELRSVIAAYAVFVSLWATFFLEFWKRHQASLAFKWGVTDFEREAEIRPEFRSDFDVPDAVTGLPTPYRSRFTFGMKFTASMVFIATAVVLTISAFAGTYIFKVFMGNVSTLDPIITVQIALVVNAGAIMILANIFKFIAKKLNDWENYRTDIEYEDQLIGKTFVFSFFNSYTTLMYFAFIKSGTELIGVSQFCSADLEGFVVGNEEGNNEYSAANLFTIDSCYGAVGYSLFIIFFSQIVVNNSMEFFLPYLKRFRKRWANFKEIKKRAEQMRLAAEQGLNRVEALVGTDGYHQGGGEEKVMEPDDVGSGMVPMRSPVEVQLLLGPYESPFGDYLELALQFGYVTLFVAAFPLAPTLALLNNFIEVWVDAKKVCILSRRPRVTSAQDIGTWYKIFETLSYVAIVTNAAVLVFTSVELIPLQVEQPENRVWAFLAIILAVFGVKRVTDFFITDTPLRVQVMQQRENFYLQKIFYDDEEVDDFGKIEVAKEIDTAAKHDQIERDYNEFKILDRDPYLNLIISEVREKMLAKNVDATKLFGQINTNNDAFINLRELRHGLLREDIGIGETMDPITLNVFLEALDINNDGKISQEELESFLKENVPQRASV